MLGLASVAGWVLASALPSEVVADIPDAAMVDEQAITITATRTPVEIEAAPLTVTVIDRDRIEEELATDIKELVRFEPGVSVRRAPARFGAAFGSTGRAGNEGFVIRGIGGNRVLIQIDGVRIPDGFSFGAQAVGRGDYVDLGLVQSVEILRGPGSALYGSDGLSGVVSFITADPADLIEEGRDLGGRASVQYASADEEWAETIALAGKAGTVSLLAAYTRRDFAELSNQGDVDVEGPLRTTPNPQDGGSDALLGKLVWLPTPSHSIRLTGEYLTTRLDTDVLSGLGAGPFGPTRVDALFARDTGERSRVMLDWTFEPNGGVIDRAHVALFWQDAEDRQFSDEDRSPAPDRVRINTFENRIWGAAAEVRSDFATGAIDHRLVVGGDINFTRQSGLRDGIVPPVGEVFPSRPFPETDFTRGGIFVGDELAIGGDRLILYPALRLDFYDLDAADDPLLPTFASVDQSGSRLTPKLGAVAAITDHVSLFGHYAQGFKAPEPGQVNQFFENLAFGYTSLPNPDLRPETSESFEAGLRYADNRLFAGLTWFHADYDDFISQEVVGGSFTPFDPALFQFVNIERVEIEGLEARLRYRGESGLEANLALAYADGDSIDAAGNRTPLSTVDPLTIVGGVGYRDPRGRFGGQLIASFHDGKAAEDAVGLCNGPCFLPEEAFILDVTAYVRLAKGVMLRGGFFNLTDETYWLWSDVRGLAADASATAAYTRPGRNASLSLNLSF